MALGGAAVVAATTGSLPTMAGPFEANEYLKTIPQDKKLDPSWVRSLFARGEKDVYTDPKALGHIGMPVGGLFAGTVYLSGDGRLWLWDIFNRDQNGILPRDEPMPEGIGIGCSKNMQGLNFVHPAPVTQPFQIGFALKQGDKTRPLDATGFRHVQFDGCYPMGRVDYRDDACPVTVCLESFSPFIPLNVEDSSLPATVMRYRVKNPTNATVEMDLVGHLQNAICLETKGQQIGQLRNRIARGGHCTSLVCSAEPLAQSDKKEPRPDIVFDRFEAPTYEGWTATGTAFGTGPIEQESLPDYQGKVGGEGKRVVNSHGSSPGDSATKKDAQVGTLTSRPFRIERRFIHFLVGGGAHKDRTCVTLLIDGKVVATATGQNDNRLAHTAWNVRPFHGKTARIQIVDQHSGRWGNIGVDHIIFTDRAPTGANALDRQRDFGTMTLTVLGPQAKDATATANVTTQGDPTVATAPLSAELVGQVGRRLRLAPGQEQSVDFVVTWHFPNFRALGVDRAPVGHWYATRFESASAVARYMAAHFDRLAGDTRAWVDTWYDSTLPYWLLDRTMANTSTLATTTCYRFADGRFWAWEGVGCCYGTCTHVWHYAQAPGRLFPEIERIERERVNFGFGQHDDGGIGMRAKLNSSNRHADDGHCGRVLGVLREHQMSADDAFLRRLWPKVKKAIEFMIRRDANADGMIEGAQPNTLDANWYGKISFLSSLYLALLRAGEAMATEMGDAPFAEQCRRIAKHGAQSILETFNGEYFVQLEDPRHKDKIGVGAGCYIDQVFGQTWAHWVGLGRLFDRDKQLSALRALWKYNFVPDVGPFRERFTRGRWYAMAGDAGLIMCSWPRGGKNAAREKHWQYGYFNECMSGFEYQAAAHMIWEGLDQPDLLQHGLAVTRAVHDRYQATLRNPYNEIECGDHYSRAMASYGVFQAACGLHCHGPRGHLEFAPRLGRTNFRAPFTSAEGWGTLTQSRAKDSQTNAVLVKHGRLRLKTLALAVEQFTPTSVRATAGNKNLPASLTITQGRAQIELAQEVVLEVGQSVEVVLV
ncbi:MAG: hypothetical protein JW818_19185 [Pirellulales bacterium]|nr:hypothetical protein [Pirellulales bacterium]